MEGGNRKKRPEEEAGPSSGLSYGSGVGASKQELNEKPSDAFDEGRREEEEEVEEEEEEEAFGDNKNGVFVPGPLLSLKEQIERDKVFFFFFSRFSTFCLFCICFSNFFDIVGLRED